MESTTARLFNSRLCPDPASLTGALFLHCRGIEDVLLAGGCVPGVGYAALDVVRIAATLMTAPNVAEDGFPRWLLPEPEREEYVPPMDEEGNPYPF
jgi:hypothetical protein